MGAYFHDAKTLNKMANNCPKTRKDLMRYIWSIGNMDDCEILKAGKYFVARIGKEIYATSITRIDSHSYSQWIECFKNKNFPTNF